MTPVLATMALDPKTLADRAAGDEEKRGDDSAERTLALDGSMLGLRRELFEKVGLGLRVLRVVLGCLGGRMREFALFSHVPPNQSL